MSLNRDRLKTLANRGSPQSDRQGARGVDDNTGMTSEEAAKSRSSPQESSREMAHEDLKALAHEGPPSSGGMETQEAVGKGGDNTTSNEEEQ